MDKQEFVMGHQAIRDHPDAAVVTVEGSVDPKTVNRFKDALQALLAAGKKRFYLDCARLSYINSSGLAYLLNLVGMVKPKDGAVAIAALDPKILVIFKMMGITELFTFYPSTADGLRELDEKIAREMRDVGPALKLEEEPPKPLPPPTPTPRYQRAMPAGRSAAPPSTGRIRTTSPPPPPPPSNPFVQFFRWLFGGGDDRPRTTRRFRR